MRICISMDAENRITSYALSGGIVNGMEIEVPDWIDLSILDHAKWDGENLVELPIEEPPKPGPGELDQLREQVAAQQEIIDILIGVAK